MLRKAVVSILSKRNLSTINPIQMEHPRGTEKTIFRENQKTVTPCDNSSVDASYAYKLSVVEAFKRLQEVSPIYKYVGDPSLLDAINKLGGIKDKEILDFGCGLGMYTRMFAEMGAKYVFGSDISAECISLAKQKERDSHHASKIEYALADCGDPSLDFRKGIADKLDEQFAKHEVSEFSMEWNPNVELSSACDCALELIFQHSDSTPSKTRTPHVSQTAHLISV